MKIGIIARTIDEKQGIGIYTLNLLDNLFKIDRHNQYVVFFRNQTYLDRFKDCRNVESVLIEAPGKLLWDQVAVPWAASKYDLDVLFHTKFSVPLLARCSTAMVMHGSEWFVFPHHYNFFDVVYQKVMLRFYLRKASVVLCVSERAKLDMIRHVDADPDKLRTVYLAANQRFRVIADEQRLEEARRRHELPDQFVMWIGRIYPGKNVGNLIRAYARIAKEVPHKLMLVGGFRWKYADDLRLIDTLNLSERVIVKDWVDPEELPTFYNLASAFVFPSWYESCPAPPWEAMACGCPVVTTPTGGTPEVVGDAALYVDPADVGAITDGLRRVLLDDALRADLIQKGFRNVRRFSWEKTARDTLGALEALAALGRLGDVAPRHSVSRRP
jgi:glycosyltransferase involved in cell wall biosynthesis